MFVAPRAFKVTRQAGAVSRAARMQFLDVHSFSLSAIKVAATATMIVPVALSICLANGIVSIYPQIRNYAPI